MHSISGFRTCTRCAVVWGAAVRRLSAISWRPRSAHCPMTVGADCKPSRISLIWAAESTSPCRISTFAVPGIYWVRSRVVLWPIWATRPIKRFSPKRFPNSKTTNLPICLPKSLRANRTKQPVASLRPSVTWSAICTPTCPKCTCPVLPNACCCTANSMDWKVTKSSRGSGAVCSTVSVRCPPRPRSCCASVRCVGLVAVAVRSGWCSNLVR